MTDEIHDELTLFPMDRVTLGIADKINREHAAVKEAGTRAIKHALEAGKLLCAAKRDVVHGDWAGWLKANCSGISARTAQLYMQFHQKRGVLAKAQCVAHLGVGAAAKLLAKPKTTRASAPPAARGRAVIQSLYRDLDPMIGELEEARDIDEAKRVAAAMREVFAPWLPQQLATTSHP